MTKSATIVGVIFILLLAACSTATPSATVTPTPKPPTTTPKAQPVKTEAAYPFPIPDYSTDIDVSADRSTLMLSNPSPVAQVAAFYKNQMLAANCALVYESGSAMDAIVFTFENCEPGDQIRILIYPYRGGTAVSITNQSE